MEDTANQGMDRAASAAQGLADTLRQRAETLPGHRTAALAYQAAGGLERGAEYLRRTDVAQMRGELEDLIRRCPIQSLAAGLAVGFLLARLSLGEARAGSEPHRAPDRQEASWRHARTPAALKEDTRWVRQPASSE